ncbi:hypothetical protein GY45DRAFT_628227 [Cubamyces sp. BRFM 1775]|nr:hypothetical protein GY45DRAFT_628227 [Cubamyces sp. BRFM 1775]
MGPAEEGLALGGTVHARWSRSVVLVSTLDSDTFSRIGRHSTRALVDVSFVGHFRARSSAVDDLWSLVASLRGHCANLPPIGADAAFLVLPGCPTSSLLSTKSLCSNNLVLHVRGHNFHAKTVQPCALIPRSTSASPDRELVWWNFHTYVRALCLS